ncbi:DNA-directed RNA polymerase subunit beta [Microgenomates group bacterium]|nr:DNA-directed RNA polymerase subunit beta [Microgenomates group bacterium]
MSIHIRRNLGKDRAKLPELDLIKLQVDSYNWFLTEGIGQSLDEVNDDKGIEDYTGKNWSLKFGAHRFGQPEMDLNTARAKEITYSAPLYAQASLLNKKTGQEQTQEVFLGDVPMMTPVGTFIINGIERAVVTQLVRSPGVFFSGENDAIVNRMLYKAELRPLRGSWIEINVGRREVITVKIDKRRKMSVTVLLRALGYGSDEQLRELFAEEIELDKHGLLLNSIEKDPTKSQNEALLEVYAKMRPGEPAVIDNAREYFKQMFYEPRRYSLGEVGRYKINRRLKIENVPLDRTTLAPEDILRTVKYLIRLQNEEGKVDDIDHLSNRRVRRVGELVQANAFRLGLTRLERSIREKMSLTKTDELLSPSSLVNARPLISAVADFFRRNRLSAILDQTNPLAEVDNLRRLSVMGSGGVTKERASFSMRDINASQYGRICPVRSPEGQNIGLVTYLSLYTRVNNFGFLEAPYFKVVEDKSGKMKVDESEIIYLSADEEEEHCITHAGIEIDAKGYIKDDWVSMRYMNNFIEGDVTEVEYIDVVPRQVIGTSASLIPFIAHDEANRALMGTHMQCQAVPLVKAQAPIIGTGMERAIATAMERSIVANFSGEVVYVDSNRIEIKLDNKELKKAAKFYAGHQSELVSFDGEKEVYTLKKFMRTTQSMCYNQHPEVRMGQKVKAGDLIIDGPSSDKGELALGTNLMIAYMAFDGLGYEDAIVISDRLVKQDTLTSVTINSYKARVMDTKLGAEELTNDIPNVAESFLKNLDVDGIVRIGSVVKGGDILVGKVAPRGETELSPEERLLRAIFGEKSKEIRDTSLRMPHGEKGTIISVEVLDRELGDELDPGVNKEVIIGVAETRKITVGDKLAGRHGNKGVISKIMPEADMPHLEDGTAIDIIISPLSVLARMNLGQLLEAHLGIAAKKLGYKVAIPAFEEFDEEKIWGELEKAGLPSDGKMRLIDGRTGERFEQDTVVGIEYILKLSHMVEDKVHARSTGPYSLVTQQPLGGKAQMGGQRLGEMEVWALEAHRAAYTLQEMLTIKSDDIAGRSKAFEAVVKGVEIPAPTVPEGFKVLMRELNSLGIDVVALESQEVEETPAKLPDEEIKLEVSVEEQLLAENAEEEGETEEVSGEEDFDAETGADDLSEVEGETEEETEELLEEEAA